MLGSAQVLNQHTCRSRSSSSSSSWVAFFCILSRAAWRDTGTSLQAVSGCREETELLGDREEGTGSLGSIVGPLAPGKMGWVLLQELPGAGAGYLRARLLLSTASRWEM